MRMKEIRTMTWAAPIRKPLTLVEMSSNIFFQEQAKKQILGETDAKLAAIDTRVRALEARGFLLAARIAALEAVPVVPAAAVVPAPNKSALAQQLLRAVQTNNGEEISRLVAAGIRLQDLPKNMNTQARLLNAITPRPVAAAAAAKTTVPVAATGELKMLDGEIYMVKNGNVYEYDQIEERTGAFVGRLKADESINRNAKEVMKGGSRKTRSRRRHSRKTRSQRSKL